MACDDQQRPYEVINSPFTDTRAPWLAMMIPLPPKVHLSGEMAETWGHRTFRELGAASGVTKAWGDLNQALATNQRMRAFAPFYAMLATTRVGSPIRTVIVESCGSCDSHGCRTMCGSWRRMIGQREMPVSRR